MKPELAAPVLDAPWPKKPMARAARVTLFEREIRERLAVAAIDLLFARAQVLSEGQRAEAPTAGRAYFGSTMLTIDVTTLADVVREPCDGRAAARVAALVRDDARVTRRVQRLAEREARRLCDGLGPAGAAGGAERGGPGTRVRAGEVRVRSQGTLVYLDVDVDEGA